MASVVICVVAGRVVGSVTTCALQRSVSSDGRRGRSGGCRCWGCGGVGRVRWSFRCGSTWDCDSALLWRGRNARGSVNEPPEAVFRCCDSLRASTEATEEADVEAFEAVDEVRWREDASEETVDSLEPAFEPPTLKRLERT